METFPPETLLKSRATPARERFLSALVLLGLGALAVAQCAGAQERQGTGGASPTPIAESPHALSFQLGGNGGLYSVHYNRHASEHWGWQLGLGVQARLTLAVVSEDDETLPSLLVGTPVGVRWRPGSGNWRPEAGLSVAPGLSGDGPAVWGGPSVGIGRLPDGGGLFLRATLTATTIATPGEARVGPGIGLEVGYTF